jgi:hypothetical protein
MTKDGVPPYGIVEAKSKSFAAHCGEALDTGGIELAQYENEEFLWERLKRCPFLLIIPLKRQRFW